MRLMNLFALLLLLPLSHGCTGQGTDTPSTAPVTTKKKGGASVSLFDGESLKGWESATGFGDFSVKDGAIVGEGDGMSGDMLVYTGPVKGGKFNDFIFRAEVKLAEESNSGILFHTDITSLYDDGYEAQVSNLTDGAQTGTLFTNDGAVVTVEKSEVKAGTWFTYEITVIGKQVTLKINDKVVTKYTEPEDIDRLDGGTFALQGPTGNAAYRKIMIQPLGD